MLTRLLDSLYTPFNKDPGRVLALRIGVLDGALTWFVADGVLSLRPTGGSAMSLDIDLSPHTISGLYTLVRQQPGYTATANFLDQAGQEDPPTAENLLLSLSSLGEWDAPILPSGNPLTVADSAQIIGLYAGFAYGVPVVTNAAIASLSALALVDSRGDAAQSNGDHLYVSTSLLWTYLRTIATQLVRARAQIVEMLRQMVMTQSEGEWAELWGSHYGVGRIAGETDTEYTARIVVEVLRARVNHLAIESVLEETLDVPVWIREPWREIFTLSQSALSGPHKLQDGDFYNYCVLEAQSKASRAAVAPLAERNKAAGVRMWYAQRIELDTGPGPTRGVFGGLNALLQWQTERSQFLILSHFPPGLSGEIILFARYIAEIGADLDARVMAYSLNGQFLRLVYDAYGMGFDAAFSSADIGANAHLLESPGGGDATIPLYAGAKWLIEDLDAAGYLCGYTELSVTQVPFGLIENVDIVITQSS